MEVLVFEDTKEVEANFSVEDDLSTVIVKKKRRVSFAQTQTIHVIPRLDEIETPPLLESDPLPRNTNPLSSSSAVETDTPRGPTDQQSAAPRVLATAHKHENSANFSPFTSDMDTGHGSWSDEDSPVHRDSFDGLEDVSGCFVHLRHISPLEDDDSVANEFSNDDLTMDATTFSRNLSQYLKSGTFFGLQGAGHLEQSMNNVNDSDTQSKEDSMALTKTGAPHWALLNPQDASNDADDVKSDMSLATESERVRPKERRNSLTENKISLPNTTEDSLPGFTAKEKENLAPRNGIASNSPGLIVDPYCDSEGSMPLSNTMDISLPLSLPRQHAVLAKIDGNSQTPPRSRRRSDILMQDMSFSTSDPNTTLPVRNLKDLLLDNTDYTISQKVYKEAELSHGKILDPHSPRSNRPDTISPCLNREHLDSHGSDLCGLSSFPDNREEVFDNWQTYSTENKDQRLAIRKNVPRIQLTDVIKSGTKSKNLAGAGQGGNTSYFANLRAPRSLEDVIQRLKNTPHIRDEQAEGQYMVQLPPTRLQTLSDYLEFSCIVQHQADWLCEYTRELEVKLLNAKKKNTEVKSRNASTQFQELPKESSYAFNSKLASKHSLAKIGWISWKLDAQKQVLSSLQESKDNLMKELEEAKTKGQQVLHLKESYSQLSPEVELAEASLNLGEAVANLAGRKKAAQVLALHQGEENERRTLAESINLDSHHRQYQEACNQFSHLTSKWNAIGSKIQRVISIHRQSSQIEKDLCLFEDDLKASIRKLVFRSVLLQQQQVMHLKVKTSGRNSVIDLSLGAMYLQSFQFEGDNPLAKVQIVKILHPEAIEMAFPCMEAPLLFQYFRSDYRMVSMELQHLYRIVQRSNYLAGCLVDVLKEVKFCRRNFGITCKFSIVNGDPLLSVTFLQNQSGIRVSLVFEMSCVQGGGYPFDKKPADVQIQAFGSAAGSRIISRREMVLKIGKIGLGFGRLARICGSVESIILASLPEKGVSSLG